MSSTGRRRFVDSRPVTAPSHRYPTKHPGITYRLDSKGHRRYYIDFTDTSQKRVFKRVPGNLEDARRERARILERMGKGEKVVNSKLTIDDLIDVYLKTQTGHLKPKTYSGYQYNLDHYVSPRLGSRKINALGVGDIAGFITQMKRDGFKAWTIRGCLTPMSGMFRYAVRQGWMSKNPILDLERNERPKSDQATMRILSTDEIQQLLASSTDTYRLLFTTAVFTGLRIGELLRLRWEDVDLLNHRIIVKESKTTAGLREVSLPDFLVRMLAGAAYTDGEVFKTREGQPMKHRRVNRALEETLKRGGIPHVRFHDLRHTFASLLIAQREPITYIAEQMGHTKASTTLDIYGKLFEGDKAMKEARMRMEENFAGVVG
jgi:integrase